MKKNKERLRGGKSILALSIKRNMEKMGKEKKQIKVIEVENVSELLSKLKHARRGTWYVLREKRLFPLVYDRRDLLEEIKYLEKFLITQRHLGMQSYPVIMFRKSEARK